MVHEDFERIKAASKQYSSVAVLTTKQKQEVVVSAMFCNRLWPEDAHPLVAGHTTWARCAINKRKERSYQLFGSWCCFSRDLVEVFPISDAIRDS
jgi:hypothetical protein